MSKTRRNDVDKLSKGRGLLKKKPQREAEWDLEDEEDEDLSYFIKFNLPYSGMLDPKKEGK